MQHHRTHPHIHRIYVHSTLHQAPVHYYHERNNRLHVRNRRNQVRTTLRRAQYCQNHARRRYNREHFWCLAV